MGAFSRFRKQLKANTHSTLDKAENVNLNLDQMARDYERSIYETEQAVAQTVGNLRLAESDLGTLFADIDDLDRKISEMTASKEKLIAANDTANAERFESVITQMVAKKAHLEAKAQSDSAKIRSQQVEADQLKAGVVGMKSKLVELQKRRQSASSDLMITEMKGLVSSVSGGDGTDVDKYAQMISNQEALNRGQIELASLHTPQPVPESAASVNDEVEARMAALLSGTTPPQQLPE
jgi:phage shock protein A